MFGCQFSQFYSYSPGLTLECQSQNSSSYICTYIELLVFFFQFSHIHLGLRLAVSCFWLCHAYPLCFFNFSIFIWTYTWLPVQTRLNSSNRFNHLGLLILKSIASIKEHFFSPLLMLSLTALSISFFFLHCPGSVGFPLFLQSLLFFHKCRNVQYAICKCHDLSY